MRISDWSSDVCSSDLLRLPVVGHHLAVFGVVVARGEVELVESEVQPVAARRGFEHAEAFGHDFLADPVPGDDGDAHAVIAHFALNRCGRGLRRSPLRSRGRSWQSPRDPGWESLDWRCRFRSLPSDWRLQPASPFARTATTPFKRLAVGWR